MRLRQKAREADRQTSITSLEPRSDATLGSEVPAVGHCQTCGQPTSNPRFCGRSCAATATNAKAPKRKPEGKCSRCWTAVSRSKKYCPSCQEAIVAEQKEQERRRTENYQIWLNPAGEKTEAPIKTMIITNVFRANVSYSNSALLLSPNSRSAELLDHIAGICCARPPYLREQNALRYIAMLHELKSFTVDDYDITTSARGVRKVEVGELPIARLGRVLERWVQSYLHCDCHPMLPSYALDVARLVEFHVGGQSRYESALSWEVAPLVAIGGESCWDRYYLFDSSFKRDFSMRFGGTLVRCQIPKRCVIDQANRLGDGRVLKADDQFLFVIRRCHLSEGSPYDWDDITFADEPIPFDLMDEFRFYGEILANDGESGWTIRGRTGIHATVPGNWITHAAVWGNGNERKLVPVPCWHPEQLPSQTDREQ
jgi:hypothetical protein